MGAASEWQGLREESVAVIAFLWRLVGAGKCDTACELPVSPAVAVQVYIEKEIYKRKAQPIDKQTSVVVGAARTEGATGAGSTTGFAAPPEAAVAAEAAAEAARLGLGLGTRPGSTQ